MKKSIFLLLLLVMTAMSGRTQETDPNFETLMKEYFVVINYYENIDKIYDQMTQIFAASYPDMGEMFTDVLNKTKEATINELPKLGVSIYSKYFTADEMRQIIDYIKSPIGQKMRDVDPQVTQKSLELGKLFVTNHKDFESSLNNNIPGDFMQAINEMYVLSNSDAQYDYLEQYFTSVGSKTDHIKELRAYGPVILANIYYGIVSIDEVNAINDFYRTPIGNKFALLLPTINKELSEGLTPIILSKIQSMF